MRPRSLAEVARMAAKGDSFDYCLANFLDEFYASPNAEALGQSPTLLAPEFGVLGRLQDSYLAATAEELASKYSLAVPGWTAGAERTLRHPWFASPLGALRAVLILESPAAFRSRNIFVSQNALARA